VRSQPCDRYHRRQSPHSVILSAAWPALLARHAESKNRYSRRGVKVRERKSYFVYIMGSLSGTLYVGLTSRPETRIFQHKEHAFAGFTSKYDVDRLLYGSPSTTC
jgi:hypothetical protein